MSANDSHRSAHYLGAVGRYAIYDELARGGMATVHLGRLRGAAGFSRIVALKRLHAQFATDPTFVSMFTDEARLCARIRHPNVVPILDVVASDDELFMVMEFVHGETLSRLIVQSRQSGAGISAPMSVAILSGVLHGLHAAHEAMNEKGQPLDIVHRDVSPQNVIVGVDGVARVLDFGVAKAIGRQATTEVGFVKGKYGYMSPEQLYGEPVDRRTDVYAAGVVLWEMLVGERLFAGVRDEPAPLRSLAAKVDPPSARVPGIPPRIDDVVARALSHDPAQRFPTALAMAHALEACTPMVKPAELGAWVRMCAAEAIESRGRLLAALEQTAADDDAPLVSVPRQEVSRNRPIAVPPPRDSGETTGLAQVTTMVEPVARRSGDATIVEAPALEKRSSTRKIAGVVALGAVLVGGALLSRWRDGSGPETGENMASAGVLAAASARETSQPPSSDTAEAQPAPSAQQPSPSTAKTTSKSTPPAINPQPGVIKPSRPICNPPYTIDSNGIKRYKKEQRSANSREQQPCTAAPTLGAMPGVAWLTSPDA
jgi:serine/threonine-protein kinase